MSIVTDSYLRAHANERIVAHVHNQREHIKRAEKRADLAERGICNMRREIDRLRRRIAELESRA